MDMDRKLFSFKLNSRFDVLKYESYIDCAACVERGKGQRPDPTKEGKI